MTLYYIGEWVNNSWIGFGIYTDEDETSYKGVLYKNTKEGFLLLLLKMERVLIKNIVKENLLVSYSKFVHLPDH